LVTIVDTQRVGIAAGCGSDFRRQMFYPFWDSARGRGEFLNLGRMVKDPGE
jgi:hypothetical protein